MKVRNRHAIFLSTAILVYSLADAQAPTVQDQVEALGLETLSLGRVTAHFSAGEQVRAEHFAQLSEDVAGFYETELGISFAFDAVVLAPEDWIQPYGADMPYGIPWCSVAERILFVPSSLQVGALIGPSATENGLMVDAIAIHEFGHLANKAFFHPDSAHEEFPVLWFEEFLADYIGYRYIANTDASWAQTYREWSSRFFEEFTPSVLSLDWSFMSELAGPDMADTYGWYQDLLTLRAADLHAEHDGKFLPALKAELDIDSMDSWDSEYLVGELDRVAPGFRQWVSDLEDGSILPNAQVP